MGGLFGDVVRPAFVGWVPRDKETDSSVLTPTRGRALPSVAPDLNGNFARPLSFRLKFNKRREF